MAEPLDCSAWLIELLAMSDKDARRAFVKRAVESPAQVAALLDADLRALRLQLLESVGDPWASTLVGAVRDLGRKLDKAARAAAQEAAQSAANAAPEVDDVPPEAGPDLPAMTDLGNAGVLVERVGSDFRWCGAMPGNGWMVWEGSRWASDDTKRITRAAAQLGAHWRQVGFVERDPGLQRTILKHASKSESAGGIRAAIELASADQRIVLRREAFDANDWLFNTPDATFDLQHVTRHQPAQGDYITKIAGVSAGPVSNCPIWITFLDRIMGGDEDMVAFLRRTAGYCLTGSTAEQCMFIAYGRGANGKSTFMSILQYIMGDYAKQTPVETFTARREGGIPNDLAALAGTRMVTCSETAEGSGLEESLVKAATGGDPIPCRFLNREFFSFEPRFKLWMLTNHKPIVKGTDEGIWRRLRLIPFEVIIPKPDQDKDLLTKLKAEAPAILRWMLEGLKEWRSQGLNPPKRVLDATAEYRKDMDALADFMLERCLVGDLSFQADNGDLYRSYSEWARDNGTRPKSHRGFTQALKDRGYNQSRTSARHWSGIRLAVHARASSDTMFEPGKRRGEG